MASHRTSFYGVAVDGHLGARGRDAAEAIGHPVLRARVLDEAEEASHPSTVFVGAGMPYVAVANHVFEARVIENRG